MNTRAAAARISWQIVDQGQSLDAALANYFDDSDHSGQDRGFIQELVYGVCRWYGELDAIAGQLLKTPIRKKDRVVHFVLLVGLYQLGKLDTAEHAAISETVSACKQLKKVWAKNLINGCLRSYQRNSPQLDESPHYLSHPAWIRSAVQQAWPQQADAIMAANDERPPMCLRVNSMQATRDAYLQRLNEADINASADHFSEDGLILSQPRPVSALPDFESGACSVQDTAAQLAAQILAPTPGMSVLDACAAPGGKTAHLLEKCGNELHMDALDISARRCEQLASTLERLQLQANVINADAARTHEWQAAEKGYDRILIDAPCSGLGVIRRHPDIKHHRRESDIDALQKTQSELLDKLWPLLKPGGRMLYMTCSILPAENEQQITLFVASRNDAMLIETGHPNALALEHGVQTLPGVHAMDGFYYCLLEKQSH